MSNGHIYNAVYSNKTKKDIYKAVMDYVSKVVISRVNRFLTLQARKEKQAELARTKATEIALQWEHENTKREVVKILTTLKKQDDKLYTTKAHNNAIELAIRHVKSKA